MTGVSYDGAGPLFAALATDAEHAVDSLDRAARNR